MVMRITNYCFKALGRHYREAANNGLHIYTVTQEGFDDTLAGLGCGVRPAIYLIR